MGIKDKIKNAEETMWPMTMGMTTQKSIEHLLDIMDSMPDDACGDWRDSLAYAIDTMRKYQKIEQILKEPCIIPEGCYPMLRKIERVIKDGNDD